MNLNQFSSAYSSSVTLSSAAGFAHVSHFTSVVECSLQTKSLQEEHLIVVTLFLALPHRRHRFRTFGAGSAVSSSCFGLYLAHLVHFMKDLPTREKIISNTL
jgi:hypothetical protein